MKIEKYLNPGRIYDILTSLLEDNHISLTNRIELYRFIDKMSDSQQFESIINKGFSAYKLKYKKDKVISAIRSREIIQLPCEFELRPYQITNWELYHCDELFLGSLDSKIATRIALDINVAFNIKLSQITNK